MTTSRRPRKWKPVWPFRRQPRAYWQKGEDLAARHLRKLGFKILDRNVRLGRNEVDIIARDGDTIVFVEVRTRQTADPVPPEDTVGPVKQRHLRAAAAWYISRNAEPGVYYRFDVVAIILPEQGKPIISYFPNAF